MELREALLSVAVALGAGALIGAERERSHGRERETRIGGIRTFPLIALLGALGALLRPALGPWVLVGLLLGVGALFVATRLRTPSAATPGSSTDFAGLLTFLLGAAAGTPELLPAADRYLLVGSAAGAAMVLLALKEPLHAFIGRVSAEDVYATAKFVLLALIVLPVLPNQGYGPYEVLNPFKIGLMIALVAGVSFAGYVAARLAGSRRGLLLAGLLGGLASSTATTVAFAGRAKENPELIVTCAATITAACSTMFVRMAVVLTVVEPELALPLALPLGASALAGFGAAAFMYRRGRATSEGGGAALKNPFEITHALQFGAIYAGVLVAAKAAETHFGRSGLFATSVVSGLADVDAITLTIAELFGGGLAAGTASAAILVAAATNTAVKAGLSAVLGTRALGARVGAALGASVAAGLLALGISLAIR